MCVVWTYDSFLLANKLPVELEVGGGCSRGEGGAVGQAGLGEMCPGGGGGLGLVAPLGGCAAKCACGGGGGYCRRPVPVSPPFCLLLLLLLLLRGISQGLLSHFVHRCRSPRPRALLDDHSWCCCCCCCSCRENPKFSCRVLSHLPLIKAQCAAWLLGARGLCREGRMTNCIYTMSRLVITLTIFCCYHYSYYLLLYSFTLFYYYSYYLLFFVTTLITCFFIITLITCLRVLDTACNDAQGGWSSTTKHNCTACHILRTTAPHPTPATCRLAKT